MLNENKTYPMIRNRDNSIRKEYTNFLCQEVKWTGFTTQVNVEGGLVNIMEKMFNNPDFDFSYYTGPTVFHL